MELLGMKKKYEEVYKYILDSIENDELGNNATNEDKIRKFIDVFHDEYDDLYHRRLYKYKYIHIANYLQGLPSICSVDYEDYRIEQLGKEWGFINSENNSGYFVYHWFEMLATRIIELADYYEISFPALAKDQ